MADFDWKTWTAIVGAVTGIASLLLQLFSKRPRFDWAPNPIEVGDVGERVKLMVHNPANSQLMISSIRCYPTGYEILPERHQHSMDNTVMDVGIRMRTGRTPPCLLKATETRAIRISKIEPDTAAWIVVWWHRFWLIPLRVPMVLRLSRSIAVEINHGGR